MDDSTSPSDAETASATSLDLLTAAVNQALEDQELTLTYQPKVALTDNHVIGFEALPEWVMPNGETVTTDGLHAIAQASGCMCRIGNWVIDEACQQLAEWQHADPTQRLGLSINVSPVQLGADLVSVLRSSIAASGVDASGLWLELTEASVQDLDAASPMVDDLASLAINISLDAHGPGLPPLSHLRRVRPRELRIASSTIRGLGHNPVDTAIVTSLIDIAHTMGCAATAAGIETAFQLELLRDLDCDAVLGAPTARPLAAREVVECVTSETLTWWPRRRLDRAAPRAATRTATTRTRAVNPLADGDLSARQLEIIDRLLRGQRVPTIARSLYVSQSTVRNHLSAIFGKFGVHSQEELLAALHRAA